MVDDTIILIREKEVQDDYGVLRNAQTKRTVYAKINSVSRSEFFAGGRAGLNPEYQFVICAADYCGEELCVFHGNSYSIYRNYHVPGTDTVELYVQRKGGTNGKIGSR